MYSQSNQPPWSYRLTRLSPQLLSSLLMVGLAGLRGEGHAQCTCPCRFILNITRSLGNNHTWGNRNLQLELITTFQVIVISYNHVFYTVIKFIIGYTEDELVIMITFFITLGSQLFSTGNIW